MRIDGFRIGFVAASFAALAFSACSSSDTTGNVDCTGQNAGDQIVASTCAISGCHSTSSANLLGAGLDLTVNATIGSRLIGVKSPGTGGSKCGGNSTPYLNANSNPATGLLIEKIHPQPSCGAQMPQVGTALTSNQQACVVQWATGLTTAAK